MGSRFSRFSKEDQIQCEKEMHSKFRTAIGKLLWMSQLRDDIKFPVKELSRSLINPQDVDFDNLIHLLKYVNQTRDYVYVMEPQIPTADSQGLIPVEVVSYSDSDWAGCQRSRRSTSGSLILVLSQSVFNKPYSGISFTLKCRSRIVCHDSGSSRLIGDQALHQGTKISDSFKRSENHSQDRLISRQDNGLTSGHFKEVKAY